MLHAASRANLQISLIASTRTSQFAAPLARLALEARAKCLVEIGKIVKPPAIRDLGNLQIALIAIAQRRAAGFQPVLEHPAPEALADLSKTRMQRAQRNAELVGDELRR